MESFIHDKAATQPWKWNGVASESSRLHAGEQSIDCQRHSSGAFWRVLSRRTLFARASVAAGCRRSTDSKPVTLDRATRPASPAVAMMIG
jgi:hypothetical protein